MQGRKMASLAVVLGDAMKMTILDSSCTYFFDGCARRVRPRPFIFEELKIVITSTGSKTNDEMETRADQVSHCRKERVPFLQNCIWISS